MGFNLRRIRLIAFPRTNPKFPLAVFVGLAYNKHAFRQKLFLSVLS